MDRNDLSAVIVHEAAVLVEDLHRITSELMGGNLETVEYALQRSGSRGHVHGRVAYGARTGVPRRRTSYTRL